MPLPVARPVLPPLDAAVKYLKRMHASGHFSNFGPLTRELEARYAEYLNVESRQIVSCANATLALAGAMRVLPRDAWLVPDWTFAATGHAVKLSGGKLHLRDVTPDDGVLSPLVVDDETQFGVVPVAPFGAELEVDRFSSWQVGVYDAAASLGTLPDLGQLADEWAVVFSLHATKVLACGEGAIAVFGSTRRAQEFRSWCNFGFGPERVAEFSAINGKLSEMSAAYALSALDQWSVEEAEWREARHLTRRGIEGLEEYFPDLLNSEVSPYWIALFRDHEQRRLVEASLKESDIETRSWWPSRLSDMPAFAGEQAAVTPEARRLALRTLGLPRFRGITSGDVEHVLGSVERALCEL